MGKKTYLEKLKDPRWQRKRLEAMQAAEFRCQWCQDDSTSLNVHHKDYLKGHEVWEYDIEQLAVLCEVCHKSGHNEVDILKLISSYAPIDGPARREECAFLIAGFMGFPIENLKSILGWDSHDWFIDGVYQAGQDAKVIASKYVKTLYEQRTKHNQT
jgi:hypothetical protein